MRIVSLIIAIVLSIFITIFALSNNQVVEINYLFGKSPIVIPVLIFALLLAGILIGLLVFSSIWWKNTRKIAALKKENKSLTDELSEVRSKVLSQQQSMSASDEEFTKDVEKE